MYNKYVYMLNTYICIILYIYSYNCIIKLQYSCENEATVCFILRGARPGHVKLKVGLYLPDNHHHPLL